jgi:Yip1 domain
MYFCKPIDRQMGKNVLITNLTNRIRDVLLAPVEFWVGQKNVEYSRWQLFVGFYFPLVVFASFAAFLGTWFGSTHFYIGFALLKALRELILFIVMYFVSLFTINQLLPVYETEKNLAVIQKLIVYSITPYLLVSVVTGLFPGLYILDALGLYSAYIYWTGTKELLSLPKGKQNGFVLVSSLVCLFVFGFLSIILWWIFVAYYQHGA